MRGCKLEFIPACETGIALPYTININLGYKHNNNNIELTASYSGPFYEKRIFDAPIAKFRFPETISYGVSTTATLKIDENPYKKKGCFYNALNYVIPRLKNI